MNLIKDLAEKYHIPYAVLRYEAAFGNVHLNAKKFGNTWSVDEAAFKKWLKYYKIDRPELDDFVERMKKKREERNPISSPS